MTSLQKASLDEMRQVAARLCRDYLTGRWKLVDADQLVVKRVSGGLSNFLYYVSLPEEDDNDTSDMALNNTTNSIDVDSIDLNEDNAIKRKRQRTCSETLAGCEPKEVLLRIYGQAHGEDADALEAMITESIVFALLSERNFGPKLYGVFPGGRIEQYIPSHTLITKELSNTKISMKIAEKMGDIHSLNIPMSKEPDWLWNCMNRWLKCIDGILQQTDWKDKQANAEIVRAFNFSEERKWLKSVIEKANYTVLFCHNDLQEGNILYPKTNSESNLLAQNGNNLTSTELNGPTTDESDFELRIIDFEYCAYNYRGFDLANHFLEWTFDYSNPEFPYFYHHKHQYPTASQRRSFIEHYLKKLNEGVIENYIPSQEELNELEHEVELFSMFSHLFWSLWSVMNVTSNIHFAYWEYAVARIQEYQLLKQKYISGHTENNNNTGNSNILG